MNRFRVSLLAAALACAGGAAFADLLITRDGATIETAGAWKVDGRRVLFTLPNGTLSSIRTDEVDLDRSALATARAAEAATAEVAPAPAPSAPILTLNEDDLAKEKGDDEEGDKEAKEESAEAPAGPLVVSSWEQMPMQDGEGVQLFGVVKNTAKSHLTAVTVTAVLYGEEGGMLANGDAQLNKTTIGPGESANFRIEFPGLPDFAAVKFQTAARGFDTRADEATPEELDQMNSEPPADENVEEAPTDAAQQAAASEAAAVEAYEANQKATGDEPPPLEN